MAQDNDPRKVWRRGWGEGAEGVHHSVTLLGAGPGGMCARVAGPRWSGEQPRCFACVYNNAMPKGMYITLCVCYACTLCIVCMHAILCYTFSHNCLICVMFVLYMSMHVACMCCVCIIYIVILHYVYCTCTFVMYMFTYFIMLFVTFTCVMCCMYT